MPNTPAGVTTDAELGAKILAGWERMSRAVPDGPRHNRRLAEHFGVEVREVEHVRDVRNGVAHPGERISRRDLERAVAIIRRTQRRRKPPAARGRGRARGKPPANKPRPATRQGTARSGKPARDRRRGKGVPKRKTLWQLVVEHWTVSLGVVLGVPALIVVLAYFGLR